jgi:hypothetical protein
VPGSLNSPELTAAHFAEGPVWRIRSRPFRHPLHSTEGRLVEPAFSFRCFRPVVAKASVAITASGQAHRSSWAGSPPEAVLDRVLAPPPNALEGSRSRSQRMGSGLVAP